MASYYTNTTAPFGGMGYNNMGAWTTTNTSNWVTVTGTTAGSSNIISGGYSNGYVAGNMVYAGGSLAGPAQRPIKDIAEEVRKWAVEFCATSPHFDASLAGFSALASRALYKELKEEGYDEVRFAYIRNKQCSHVFCVVADTFKYNKPEYVVDLCANLFDLEDISIKELDKVDPITEPWWDVSIEYTSESGLLARQRKDGWLPHEITFTAAKTKKVTEKLSFSEDEPSDISNLQLKISPFDADSKKYLDRHSRGEGLKTSLAKLMLDADPVIAKAALGIAQLLAKK